MSDTNYESLMDNEVGTASVVDVGSKDEEEVEEVVPVAASSSNDDDDDAKPLQNQGIFHLFSISHTHTHTHTHIRCSFLHLIIHQFGSAHSKCL